MDAGRCVTCRGDRAAASKDVVIASGHLGLWHVAQTSAGGSGHEHAIPDQEAARWFLGSDEGAHETTVYPRCHRVYIQPRPRKERPGIVHTVDACGSNVGVFETHCQWKPLGFRLLEGARYAASPKFHAPPDSLRYLTSNSYVRCGEPAARPGHSVSLAQRSPLLGGEVDDAAGDHDVNRAVGKWDCLDLLSWSCWERAQLVGGRACQQSCCRVTRLLACGREICDTKATRFPWVNRATERLMD